MSGRLSSALEADRDVSRVQTGARCQAIDSLRKGNVKDSRGEQLVHLRVCLVCRKEAIDAIEILSHEVMEDALRERCLLRSVEP